MTPKLHLFLNKLTDTIKRDVDLIPIMDYINSNIAEADSLVFSVSDIKDLKKFNFETNSLLKMMFDYSTRNRGDKRGKGELLLVFLIEDAHFSSDCDIKIGDKKYEIKAYDKDSDSVAFGVENTFTLAPFGLKLLFLFHKIYSKRDDLSFVSNHYFWFDKTNRRGSNWENKTKVEKLLAMEISGSDFTNIFNEIPKLKGVIEHEYISDINNLKNDIELWDSDFNSRDKNIVLFVKYKMLNDDSKLRTSLVTQSRIKMVLS